MIDLQKKVEIVLAKRNALSVRARAGLAIDVSGSMQALYKSGTVQQTLDRFLALALRLDDDKQLDCWTFDNQAQQLEPITEAGHSDYVRREILQAGAATWGGTEYAPPLEAALKHWFPRAGLLSRVFGKSRAASGVPALLIFATDGQNQDQREAQAAMEKAAGKPLYVAFIGIGAGPFSFIRAEADRRSNVGFLTAPDLNRITDEDLYDRLVTQEMVDWLKAAAVSAAA